MTPKEFTEVKSRVAAAKEIDRVAMWFIQTLHETPPGVIFPVADDISLSAGTERGWVLTGIAHRTNFVGYYEHALRPDGTISGRLYFRILDGEAKLGKEFLSIEISQLAAQLPEGLALSPNYVGESIDEAGVLRATLLKILQALQKTLPVIN